MKLKSFLIPQADRLESVVMAIRAIGYGAKTDAEIIIGIPGLNNSRQGRYYRDAAELLGFVETYNNNSSLTAVGNQFLQNPVIQNPIFINSVLKIELVQRSILFFELNQKATAKQIINFLLDIIDDETSFSTVQRRFRTLISWLETLDIIRRENNDFFFNNFINLDVPILNILDDQQPLLPTVRELTDFQTISERVASAEACVLIYKDQVKVERAIHAHIKLVNLVANRIASAGGVPKSNQLIDLATSMGQDYIFEMKSTNTENTRSQVRKGISQLHEYRYLQDKKEAQLILVIENELDVPNRWMLDYLENDQDIRLIWNGDNQLHASEMTRHHIPFLNLIP